MLKIVFNIFAPSNNDFFYLLYQPQVTTPGTTMECFIMPVGLMIPFTRFRQEFYSSISLQYLNELL